MLDRSNELMSVLCQDRVSELGPEECTDKGAVVGIVVAVISGVVVMGLCVGLLCCAYAWIVSKQLWKIKTIRLR